MNIPNHVAIIMDGNGRWASEKGKSRSVGHKEGSKTLEKLALYAKTDEKLKRACEDILIDENVSDVNKNNILNQ